MPPRVRIAPSPTGDPHVGTAYVALFNRTFAKKHGGQFLLRIEDTDRTRSTRESEDAIYRALRWLGLDWDEGPDVGGPHAPYRQSERSAIYREHAELLISNGGAYRCFCTAERLAELRAFQQAAKQAPGYDGKCRSVPADESARRAAAGEANVIRLRIPSDGATEFDDVLRGKITIGNKEIDDQVLLKSDGFPTYHLANVVDDHLMWITHVLRAEEWIPSTPKHVLLYRAFGWEPPVFCHLPLLRNQDKSKISKRKNPTSIEWYRDQGYLPAALLNFLGLMGWAPKDGNEVFDLARFSSLFEPDQITTTGPVFDLTKLDWLNGEHIRLLPVADLTRRIAEFTKRDPSTPNLEAIVALCQERIKKLAEFEEMAGFFFVKDVPLEKTAFDAVKKLTPADRVVALEDALAKLRAATAIGKDLEPSMRDAATAKGWKIGDYFMCLRIAVTGKTATPPLLESLAILGKEESVRRVERALAIARG